MIRHDPSQYFHDVVPTAPPMQVNTKLGPQAVQAGALAASHGHSGTASTRPSADHVGVWPALAVSMSLLLILSWMASRRFSGVHRLLAVPSSTLGARAECPPESNAKLSGR